MFDFLARLKDSLVPQGGNLERTVKSGIWMSTIRGTGRTLQLIKLIILARLLAPADFGLMGIALISLAALQRFSKLGFDEALIHRKETNVDHYLNTAWTVRLVRGFLLAGILFLLAPGISSFFSMPRATSVIQGMAILPVLVGLRNPGMVYFSKDLEFHKRFAFDFTGNMTNFVGTVGFALIYPSVWALVFGHIVQDAIKAIISYRLHGHRPWPEFDLGLTKELFGYGRWIMGSGILTFLINEADDAFVGWLLGATALGFYQLAYRFSNSPATEVAHVISSVTFPAYSNIQDDIDRLREGFFKTLQVTTMFSFPMAFGIFAVAPVFVQVFLGTKWLPMVAVLQLLAIWGLIRSIAATLAPLFQAVGRPDYSTKIQALKLAVIVVLIYPASTTWGITGTAGALVVSALVSNPVGDYLAIKQIEGSISEFLMILIYPALGSLIMTLGVLLVRENTSTSVLSFSLLVIVGISIYAAFLFAADSHLGYDIRSTFRIVANAIR